MNSALLTEASASSQCCPMSLRGITVHTMITVNTNITQYKHVMKISPVQSAPPPSPPPPTPPCWDAHRDSRRKRKKKTKEEETEEKKKLGCFFLCFYDAQMYYLKRLWLPNDTVPPSATSINHSHPGKSTTSQSKFASSQQALLRHISRCNFLLRTWWPAPRGELPWL